MRGYQHSLSSLLLLLIGVCSATPSLAQAPTKIIVNDVAGLGLSGAQLNGLSSLVQNELQRYSTIAIINPGDETPTNANYLLTTTVNGVGSTFIVTAKLYNLADDTVSPLVVSQQGHRATQTFEEATVQVIRNLSQLAKLNQPPLTTALATANESNAITATMATSQSGNETSHTDAWYQQWWIWTLVGSAAIGATAILLNQGGSTTTNVTSTAVSSNLGNSANQPISIGTTIHIR